MRAIKIILVVALAGIAGLLIFAPPRTLPEVRRADVQRPPERPRTWFPAGRPAIVALPDGQSRKVGSVLNVKRRMQYGEYVWNDDHVPPGTAWVLVDLAGQTLSVFRAGQEIGSAVILYGTDGKPTPSGTFNILERAKVHRSTLYDAEMPFMLRLTMDGVAIHASNVRQGSATHGCIGIPPAFASLLYAQMKRGDLVAILPAAKSSGQPPSSAAAGA